MKSAPPVSSYLFRIVSKHGFRRTPTKLQKAPVSQARNESRAYDASASHSVDPILTGAIFHVAQYQPVARYRCGCEPKAPKPTCRKACANLRTQYRSESALHLRLRHGTSVRGPQTTGIELWLPVRIDQFQSINPAWRLLNGRKSGSLKSAACGTPPCRAYRP